jgi:murein DD-endopeptidase MepM/ murein hydrolase activator NlpD
MGCLRSTVLGCVASVASGSSGGVVRDVASKRYTIVIASRTTGVVRRLTISLWPTVWAVIALFSLPVLIGMGARWSASAEISALRVSVATSEMENASYRAATKELTTQIQSIEDAVGKLTAQSALDPATAGALARLPAIVRARAMGGGTDSGVGLRSVLSPTLSSPEDTFGMVRDLLGQLESRLQIVRTDVEKRSALAAATPSIWPAIGWLSATYGNRADPFTGAPEFHSGVDISTDKGNPVFATAAGTVEAASYNGPYGNMVVVNHGFGLMTRYAHLSGYAVKVGDRVERGRVLGYVGATGRATGSHLHYELLVNGQLTNPLRLLTDARR